LGRGKKKNHLGSACHPKNGVSMQMGGHGGRCWSIHGEPTEKTTDDAEKIRGGGWGPQNGRCGGANQKGQKKKNRCPGGVQKHRGKSEKKKGKKKTKGCIKNTARLETSAGGQPWEQEKKTTFGPRKGPNKVWEPIFPPRRRDLEKKRGLSKKNKTSNVKSGIGVFATTTGERMGHGEKKKQKKNQEQVGRRAEELL